MKRLKPPPASKLASPELDPRKLPAIRIIKDTLTNRMRLALELMTFMADQGAPRYAQVLERCGVILNEVASRSLSTAS